MDRAPLVVLGATGHTGRAITRWLLARTSSPLVLAGRDPARLQSLAAALGAGAAGRVTTARADASDDASLRAAFAGARMVVVASSTSPHTTRLARACIAAGADSFDLAVSARKLAELRAIEADIVRAGRCFISDGGFHPGLPAAMIRAVAPRFDALERAVVQSVIAVDWRALALAPSTVDEFLDEILHMEMDFYRGSRWRSANWLSLSDFPVMDFGPPFGRRPGAPMHLAEMRALPALFPALRETGFYVGGFNPFVDWVVFPLALAALRVAPRAARAPVAALLLWGLRTFSRPPFGTLLRVDAAGMKAGAAARHLLTIAHPDGYELTAIAAVAAIEQYLDGAIAGPGLRLQALAVDPARLLVDLAAMGAEVTQGPHG